MPFQRVDGKTMLKKYGWVAIVVSSCFQKKSGNIVECICILSVLLFLFGGSSFWKKLYGEQIHRKNGG